MGRFRDLSSGVVISEEIDKMMVDLGYTLKMDDYNGVDEVSFYKGYAVDDDAYYYRLSVGRKSVYVYKELYVGGYEGEWTFAVSAEDRETTDTFSDFLDNVFGMVGL